MDFWKRTIFFAILLAWPGTTACAAIVDRIVAQVNNEIITLSELEQTIKYLQVDPATGGKVKDNDAVRRQTLDSLIDRKLAKEEAKRLGLTVSDKEIQKTLDDIKKRNNITDDEAFARQLAKDGLSLEQLRQQISENLTRDRLIQIMVRSKVKVSEEDMRRFYEEFKRHGGGQQVRVQVIEIPYAGDSDADKEATRALAEKAFLELRQGKSMESVSQKLQQEGKAVKLVDPGYVSPQQAQDPRFAQFIDSLRPGEVVPVRNPAGFQIIKLVDRKGADAGATFEEAKPQIQNILLQQEMEKKFSEWVKQLRQKALIKIFL